MPKPFGIPGSTDFGDSVEFSTNYWLQSSCKERNKKIVIRETIYNNRIYKNVYYNDFFIFGLLAYVFDR